MHEIPLKSLAAFLAGFDPDHALGFRELADGSVSIITPVGQKFHYTPEQLFQAYDRMERQAAEVAELVTETAAGEVDPDTIVTTTTTAARPGAAPTLKTAPDGPGLPLAEMVTEPPTRLAKPVAKPAGKPAKKAKK